MALIKLTNQRNVVTKEGYKEIKDVINEILNLNAKFIEVTQKLGTQEFKALLNINHIIAVVDGK